MVTRNQQRLVTGGLVVAALVAITLGSLYQGERLDDGSTGFVGGDPGGTTQASGEASGGAEPGPPQNPIEGFLPRSGEASACREPVGVDLIPGYAATLTINGVEIPPEQMNVNIDADGEVSRELTASRSLSQYTFGPEDDCPNGEILRATNNVVRACVYRLEDGPDNCAVTEFTFDVL